MAVTRLLTSASSMVSVPTGSATPMTKSSSNISGNWLFYSNSPEQILTSATADSAKFLNCVSGSLVGSGRIYVWHENQTGSTIKHQILIYNPSSTSSITVTPTNVGKTIWSYNDVNAWTDFWNGTGVDAPVTIPPQKYGSLFLRSIPNGAPFGIVASVDVKYSNGADAPVTLYDIAWINDANADKATGYATNDSVSSLRKRGYALNGYFNFLNLNQVSITDSNYSTPKIFTLGTSTDTFGGDDCPYIIDPSDATRNGKLAGAYGCQQYVSIPVVNNSSVPRKVVIFAGNKNTGGDILFNAYGYSGNTAPTTSLLTGDHYYDIISETLNPGASNTYTFQFVITAGGSAPTTMGVRVV